MKAFKILFCLVLFFVFKFVDAETMYFFQYKKIVDDTVLNDGVLISKEYASMKKVNKDKGEIRCVRQYKNKRLIFRNDISSLGIQTMYYYIYDATGKLVSEHEYSRYKLERVTHFMYQGNLLEKSVSDTPYLTSTMLYEFDEKGRILNEVYYKWPYKYLLQRTIYIDDPQFTKWYVTVTDTSSSFLKYDTLYCKLRDKVSNDLHYFSDGLSYFKKFDAHGKLVSEINFYYENGYFSNYSKYSYNSTDKIICLEEFHSPPKLRYFADIKSAESVIIPDFEKLSHKIDKIRLED